MHLISGFRNCRVLLGIPIFLTLLNILFIDPSTAEIPHGASAVVERLLQDAHAKALHEKRYWRILLHYQPALSGFKSQIDDPAFFLANNGKTDPAAELDATIRYLFDPTDPNPEKAICRFYARYRWLRNQLPLNPAVFPEISCEKIQRIKPESAALIFPTYYLNSPASMFGHTFLIVNTEYTTRRLADAVNYAAVAPDANGLSFAFKGLLGFYKGYYSVMPYYKKIQEYNNMDQRDIWEYELDLTPAELERMIWHIKELDQIYTEYYFFDENCSYNILFLLESARPDAHLTDRFPLTVVPIDTVKAVKAEGLITKAAFRPSKATELSNKIKKLSASERATTLAVLHNDRQPDTVLTDNTISRESKIKILETTRDHIQYQYAKNDMSRRVYQTRLVETLRLRSKLGQAASAQDTAPVPPRPDLGHDSRRIGLGVGGYNGDLFCELRLRPTFGDLLDSDTIAPDQGAQIEFGDLRVRYFPTDARFELYKFDIIDIISLSPRNDFFKPISWKALTGFHQKTMPDGDEALVYCLNGGAGLSYNTGPPGLVYMMIEANADIGGAMPGSYAIGGGPALGLLTRITPAWKSLLSGYAYFLGGGAAHLAAAVRLSQNWRIVRNSHLRADISHKWAHGFKRFECQLTLHYFF